jgi:hypothetical protein
MKKVSYNSFPELKLGMRVRTTNICRYLHGKGWEGVIDIVVDGSTVPRVYFHEQRRSLWVSQKRLQILPTAFKAKVIKCDEHSSDISQKHVNEEVSIEARGTTHHICRCADGSSIVFADEELDIKEAICIKE